MAAIPLRLSREQDFRIIRDFFSHADFTDQRLCKELRLEDMSDLGRVQWESLPLSDLSPSLQLAIDLFLRGRSRPRAEVLATIREETLNSFERTGLLRQSLATSDHLLCPVWVYPVCGCVVVSDRRDDPDGQAAEPPADVVFPAIYAGTLRFLRLLPDLFTGEALDLCGGSGIGALVLAKNARRAVTSDLTERSAYFANFNAKLNDLPIESLRGDLFAPVGDQEFDLITAHPPFVPAIGDTMIYRDGGDTGEEVTRRIIQNLPRYLRRGGSAIILCVARDTLEAPLERRVAEWLGPDHHDFEVLFGLEKVLSVEEVARSIRRRSGFSSDDDAKRLLERLAERGTRQFVYGAIYLRRTGGRSSLPPHRVKISPAAALRDLEWLLDWRSFASREGFVDWLACSTPHPAPELEMRARYIVKDGELAPDEFVLCTESALPAAVRPDGWLIPLIARLNGQNSVQDVYRAARDSGEILNGFPFEAFLKLVADLVERGLLQVQFPREGSR